MSTQDVDASIIKKYEQLKKRVDEIEQDNSDIHTKLVRAKKHVKRLRMERLILLEQLDEYYTSHKDLMETSESDDSDASGIGSMAPDARSNKQHKKKRARHNDKSSGNTKNANKSQETTMARKKKDPNAPKGPGNVFFLYCRMERGNFKDELPTENLGEVTRLLGQKWKAMTDDEKKKYYDIYDKEQEEYQKAMKSYTEAGGGDAGRIAVSEMNATNKEDVDMIQNGPDEEDDMDEEEDDDDVDEDDEEEDNGSFLDDASVATTNQSTTLDLPSVNTTTILALSNDQGPTGPITNSTSQ
ncbi:hypothetical protein BC941DRAFT_413679 [Chlamydoabsidia padenii]|nr:hypothetical protein BC941DRAFT_413679 [Chlamydoabsidia padenii]